MEPMSINILVVDDEQSIADLIEVYLKNEGLIVYIFSNPSLFLDKFLFKRYSYLYINIASAWFLTNFSQSKIFVLSVDHFIIIPVNVPIMVV